MQIHMQAVPSGSGRLSLGVLPEQQQSFAVSHDAHNSGKALITAALSKMGFTMRSGKVGQQHKVLCVPQTGPAHMHFGNATCQHLSVIGPTKHCRLDWTSCGKYNTRASCITADDLCRTGSVRYCPYQQKLSVLPCTSLPVSCPFM